MNGQFYQNPTFPSNNYTTPPGNISVNDPGLKHFV